MTSGRSVTFAEDLVDQLVQRLLHRQFAVGGEVGAAAPGTRDHLALAVGEDGFGLGAACIDADDERWGVRGPASRDREYILRARAPSFDRA